MTLTVSDVKNAKPKEKNYRLIDGGGLYLEISKAGGKWWRFKYRYGGKEKRISVGTFPDVSLKEAREKRVDAKKLLNNGIDPSEHKKAIKMAIKKADDPDSFEHLAREWHIKFKLNWSADYADRILTN